MEPGANICSGQASVVPEDIVTNGCNPVFNAATSLSQMRIYVCDIESGCNVYLAIELKRMMQDQSTGYITGVGKQCLPCLRLHLRKREQVQVDDSSSDRLLPLACVRSR